MLVLFNSHLYPEIWYLVVSSHICVCHHVDEVGIAFSIYISPYAFLYQKWFTFLLSSYSVSWITVVSDTGPNLKITSRLIQFNFIHLIKAFLTLYFPVFIQLLIRTLIFSFIPWKTNFFVSLVRVVVWYCFTVSLISVI